MTESGDWTVRAMVAAPESAVAFVLGVVIGRERTPKTDQQVSTLITDLYRRGVYKLADHRELGVACNLGVLVGRKKTPDTPGQVATLVAELRSYGVYGLMLGALDPNLATAVRLMSAAGQTRR